MRTLIIILCVVLFEPTSSTAKLRMVGTLPDFTALAAELGGVRVEAESLILGTQNPHFVDPKPSFIVAVNRADLLVCIGMQLEAGWLPVLLTQSRNSDVQMGARGYLDASQVIQPQEVPHNPDRAMGDIHACGNPHYYTSPVEMYKVAHAIYRKLVELDPVGRNYYENRWKAFHNQYQAKLTEWAQKLLPLKGKKVVVYHNSWIYFLDWAGFERIGTLEPKPGIPPSVKHITHLIAKARSLGIYQVWQESYHPKRLSKIFTDKVGARLLVLPSMVGAEPGINTITDKFDHMVKLIAKKEKENP